MNKLQQQRSALKEIRTWYRANCAQIAGVDEAGRGPLAGPVVAAAVVLSANHGIRGLDDSKLISAQNRLNLYRIIKKRSLAYSVCMVDVAGIDRLNILQASLTAMNMSLENVYRSLDSALIGVLIDGNQKIRTNLPIEQRTIIKGDGLFAPIMAASIVAKVVRDRYMRLMHQRYPVYGFNVHKGYATEQHRQALVEHGPCVIHRRSFMPVRQLSLFSPFEKGGAKGILEFADTINPS